MTDLVERDAAAEVAGDEPQRYRFTVEAFNRIVQAGLFAAEERLELIDGEIYKVSPEHPDAEAIRLAVEVSDTTYRFDRGPKLAMYARAGVGAVWIVDVQQARIEVFLDPVGDTYNTIEVVERGGAVTVPGTDVTLAVAEILPS